MSTGIVVFDKNLKKSEVKEVMYLTSAKSVSKVTIDFVAINQFRSIVLENSRLADMSALRLEDYAGLSILCLSKVNPVMILKGDELTLQKIEKYGMLAGSAEHLRRVYKVMCGSCANMIKTQIDLGIPANIHIPKWLSGNISSTLDMEFDQVIKSASDYYYSVCVEDA